jgi:hypothetical protein
MTSPAAEPPIPKPFPNESNQLTSAKPTLLKTPSAESEARDFRRFSELEMYALMRAHPRRAMVSMASLPWVIYFLWDHQWREALTIAVVAGVYGLYLVRNVNFKLMSTTTLGKIALLHLNPVNFILQSIGLISMIYGVWMHSVEYILAALTLIFMGHVRGWGAVDPKFFTRF